MITIQLSKFTPNYDPQLEKNYEIERQIITSVSQTMAKAIDIELKNIILTYSVPPIKGEITAGKIKWRGIKLCIQNDFDNSTHWVEQRGVKIGKEFVINYNFKL